MPEAEVIPAAEALPQIRALIQKLELEVRAAANDPAVALSIMESILSAETEEEVYERQEAGTIASKDFVLRPFRVTIDDINWKKSAPQYVEQGAFPFYALLNATDMETGDDVVIDMGGSTCVASLVKLIDLDNGDGKGPFSRYGAEGKPLQFVPKPVSSGYNVILLKPVRLAEEAAGGKKSKR